jgi:hypothetical protein
VWRWAPQARGESLRLRRAGTASRGPLNADVKHHSRNAEPSEINHWTGSRVTSNPVDLPQLARFACAAAAFCSIPAPPACRGVPCSPRFVAPVDIAASITGITE